MRRLSPLSPLHGSRIGMSPWSRQAIDADTLASLEARCFEMDVIVSTVKRSDRAWMIRVNGDGGRKATSLVGKGPLSAVIAGALDDYEAAA